MAIGNISAARSLPQRNIDLVSFKILSDGTDITTRIGLLSLSIEQAVNRVGWATLQMHEGDIPAQTMPFSDQDWFSPGKLIEIQAGYNLQETTLFKGIVVRHEVRQLTRRSPVLVIECREAAYKMTRIRKSAYYSNISDSDIFAQIAAGYNLNTDIERTSTQHPVVVQQHCTDWDFILSRADQKGMFTLTSDEKLTIKKPDFQAVPVVALRYSSGQILEFEGEIDARNTVPGVVASVWAPADQTIADETGNAPAVLQQQGNLSASTVAGVLHSGDARFWHGADLPSAAVQEWADTQSMRYQLAAIRGRVRIIGFEGIRPMDWISFDGFGDRFNGPAFVSAIRHEIEGGHWSTDIEFGLAPELYGVNTPDLAAPPAGGLTAPVHGLHIGVVTKLEDDENITDSQRVRVRIPYIQPSGDGIWARWSTPFAGNMNSNAYGMVFKPEIGDEVIIGFVDDDPNHAVVLGALFSQNRAAPVPAADANPEKGIYMREGMKLIFNDDEKSVTILTQGGNKLVLSDNDQKILLEDQRGAKLEMSSSGITLDAGSGTVTINGSQILLG